MARSASTHARCVGDLDEFALIERIARRLGKGSPLPGPRVGIGDDAAVLRVPRGHELAVSTDGFVDGVHFRFDWQSPARVGRRIAAAAVSDLAAMGAAPSGLVQAMALPKALALPVLDALVGGIARAAEHHGCPVVGGNLSSSRELQVTLTALGTVAKGRALTRDRAQPGDRLFVTGALGAQALDRHRAAREGESMRRVPEARLAAGRALAGRRDVGACIDVSDGLTQDLGHVLAASGGLGAELDSAAIPLARGVRAGARRLGLDPLVLAVTGGEDYELLFTLRRRSRATPAALSRGLGVPVHEIGRVTVEPGLSGLPEAAVRGGWRHFERRRR